MKALIKKQETTKQHLITCVSDKAKSTFNTIDKTQSSSSINQPKTRTTVQVQLNTYFQFGFISIQSLHFTIQNLEEE